MLNKIKIICALLCIMMIQSTSAVFFTGEVLKKDDITVVILGDLHMEPDTNRDYPITARQKKDLLTFSKINNAYLIVEDCLKYEGSNPEIVKEIKILNQSLSNLTMLTMIGLCDLCNTENIKNCSCECRHAQNTNDKIRENEQTFSNIKAFDNPVAKEYFDILWKQHNSLLTKQEYYKFNTDSLLELNTVYKLWKALKDPNNKLLIIAVGAAHVRPISELIKNIFKFNSVLRKNYFRMPDFLGSPEKNKELDIKMYKITLDHALNLPQFFDEALRAQPIRSRL